MWHGSLLSPSPSTPFNSSLTLLHVTNKNQLNCPLFLPRETRWKGRNGCVDFVCETHRGSPLTDSSICILTPDSPSPVTISTPLFDCCPMIARCFKDTIHLPILSLSFPLRRWKKQGEQASDWAGCVLCGRLELRPYHNLRDLVMSPSVCVTKGHTTSHFESILFKNSTPYSWSSWDLIYLSPETVFSRPSNLS